jgi:hypothetical protein
MTEQEKRAALASITERATIAERAGLISTAKSWRELHMNVGCRPAAQIIMAASRCLRAASAADIPLNKGANKMNLKNQPPVFVPNVYRNEIKRLPKAALMDMVWDLAQRCAGVDDNHPRQIMEEIQRTAEIITTYRKNEHKPWRERVYGTES